VDDVLDVTQTSEQLGKTAGKDTAAQKATYPALFGIEESVRKADSLVSAAFSELESFGERGGDSEGVGAVFGGAEKVEAEFGTKKTINA
jgi:geranylgeranyl pyrophosphate synthase